jgi:uncharacterized protein (DUF885 family)
LRNHAEKEFGQKFDLRAFHDEVLKHGALPMSVLDPHKKMGREGKVSVGLF